MGRRKQKKKCFFLPALGCTVSIQQIPEEGVSFSVPLSLSQAISGLSGPGWFVLKTALPQAAQHPQSPSSLHHHQVLPHVKSPIPNPTERTRPFIHSTSIYYTTNLLGTPLIPGKAANKTRDLLLPSLSKNTKICLRMTIYGSFEEIKETWRFNERVLTTKITVHSHH